MLSVAFTATDTLLLAKNRLLRLEHYHAIGKQAYKKENKKRSCLMRLLKGQSIFYKNASKRYHDVISGKLKQRDEF